VHRHANAIFSKRFPPFNRFFPQPPFVDFQQSELEVVLVQCFTIIIIVIIFAEKHSKI